MDLDQARADVLAAARRHGDLRRHCNDSGRFHDEILTRNALNKACDEYSQALEEKRAERPGDVR